MSLLKLAVLNISDNVFRSYIVALSAGLVASLMLVSIVLARGTAETLRLAKDRLGADIMVVPAGSQATVEHALLMGNPTTLWMSNSVLTGIQAMPEVAIVSPQLFLSTMRGASCCSVSDMFMIAYDPATDFTIRPWLEKNLERALGLGEAVGGRYVIIPEGRENILIYGYEIELVGNLEPTGSGLDQSMFFTFDTALQIAERSPMQAERELVIAPDSISAAMVRLRTGVDPQAVAAQIEATVPGVSAIANTRLFKTQREQVNRMIRSLFTLSGIAWALSIPLIGLMTSTTIAERRQQIGVLRAIGATRGSVLKTLLFEVEVLALAGSALGVAISIYGLSLFRNLVARMAGVPVLFPEPQVMVGLALAILLISLGSAALAAYFPILRINALEPGTAIKEW